MDFVVTFVKRVPFDIITDQVRMIRWQLGEIELDGRKDNRRIVAKDGDMKLTPLDEFFDKNGWLEFRKYLIETLAKATIVIHD